MNTTIIIAIVLLVIVFSVGGYFLFKPAAPAAPPVVPSVDEEAQFDAALALLGGSSDVVEEFTTKECDDVLNDTNRYYKMVESSNSIGRLKEIRDGIQRMDKEVLKFKDCPRVGPAYRNFKRMVVGKFQNVTKDLCSKLSNVLKKYSQKLKQAKTQEEIEKIMTDEFPKEANKVSDFYGLGGPGEELIFIICPNMKKEYLSFIQVYITKLFQIKPELRKEANSVCPSLKKILALVKAVKTVKEYVSVMTSIKNVDRKHSMLCIEYYEIMLLLGTLHNKFSKLSQTSVEPFSQHF